MRDLVFSALFFIMAVYSIQGAFLAMPLWIWSALWPANEYLYGFAQSFPFNKISAICTVIALTYDKKKSVALDPLLRWLLVLLLEVTYSFFTSNTAPGWGEMYYENLVKIVFAAMMIRFVVTDRLRLQLCILAIGTAVGAGAADEGLKFLLSGGSHHVKGPGSWGDENSTASIILMGIPLIAYLLRYAMNPIFRMVAQGAIAISVIAVIGTYSRGGFIGLSILSLLVFRQTKSKLRNLVLFSFVLMIGMSAVPESWTARIMTTSQAEQDSSFMYRVVQWKILTLMALDAPIFGNGILANLEPATWGRYAVRLTNELTFIKTPPPLYPQASHSIFFQMLGENGFLGLGLFILVHVLAFRTGRAISRAVAGQPEMMWADDLSKALRNSLMLYLVTGAALPIPYLEFPYLLFGCLSALHHIQKTAAQPVLAVTPATKPPLSGFKPARSGST